MQEKRTQQLQSFCQGLGIHMHDLELLDMALTHTSYAHELSSILNRIIMSGLSFWVIPCSALS